MDSVFLRRVVLQNYKSIASCDVRLGPLTFLVGPNGSGKSNFLDALRFVTDSLRASLEHALRERGGMQEVVRRGVIFSAPLGCRLDFCIGGNLSGHYAFSITSSRRRSFSVTEELCAIRDSTSGAEASYHVREGKVVESTMAIPPPVQQDRLYLVYAAGFQEFRPLYDHLSKLGIYNFNPERMRATQRPTPGDILLRDGGNLARVWASLSARSPDSKRRVEEYLTAVVPRISAVNAIDYGAFESLEFRQALDEKGVSLFSPGNMSDGTLRALAALVALFQLDDTGAHLPLVAIEEPETALHPAAAAVLQDAMFEASSSTQVLITSHSPELVDDPSRIGAEHLLAVDLSDGATRIARLDEAGRSALRDRLFSPGELLRLNQLVPEPPASRADGAAHPLIFESMEPAAVD